MRQVYPCLYVTGVGFLIKVVEPGSFQQQPLCSVGSVQGHLGGPPNSFQLAAEQRPFAGDWTPDTLGCAPWGLFPSPIEHMTADHFSFWIHPVLPLGRTQETSPQLSVTDGSVYPPFTGSIAPSPYQVTNVGPLSNAGLSMELPRGSPWLPESQLTMVTVALSSQDQYHQSTRDSEEPALEAPMTVQNPLDTNHIPTGHSAPVGLQLPLSKYGTPASGERSPDELTLPDVGIAEAAIKTEEPERPDYSQWEVSIDPSHSSDNHPSSSEQKKRARFAEILRKQTSKTRSMGACLRCHNQRVRVSGSEITTCLLTPGLGG